MNAQIQLRVINQKKQKINLLRNNLLTFRIKFLSR